MGSILFVQVKIHMFIFGIMRALVALVQGMKTVQGMKIPLGHMNTFYHRVFQLQFLGLV
jgi:hypothetical protein